MALDKIALIFAVIMFVIWSSVLVLGLISTWPFGIPLLLVAAVVGYMLFSVVRDRLNNEEDDYYDKNIDQ